MITASFDKGNKKLWLKNSQSLYVTSSNELWETFMNKRTPTLATRNIRDFP